jgi:hypothetical protein
MKGKLHKICKHHKRKKLRYSKWMIWAEKQHDKGMMQIFCTDCGLYFFPSEMGKKPKQKKGEK